MSWTQSRNVTVMPWPASDDQLGVLMICGRVVWRCSWRNVIRAVGRTPSRACRRRRRRGTVRAGPACSRSVTPSTLLSNVITAIVLAANGAVAALMMLPAASTSRLVRVVISSESTLAGSAVLLPHHSFCRTMLTLVWGPRSIACDRARVERREVEPEQVVAAQEGLVVEVLEPRAVVALPGDLELVPPLPVHGERAEVAVRADVHRVQRPVADALTGGRVDVVHVERAPGEAGVGREVDRPAGDLDLAGRLGQDQGGARLLAGEELVLGGERLRRSDRLGVALVGQAAR